MKIAFIGLGRMGKGMAVRLLNAGHDLTVYDRIPENMEPLRVAGATAAASVTAAVKDRRVIITMLPDDKSLHELVHSGGGLLASMARDTIHMTMGTHGVDLVQELTESHSNSDQVFVTAHVLGRPDLAANGELSIIPAGPAKAIKELQPLFDVMGKRVFIAGEDPRSATVLKIAHNFVLGCAIEVMGESFSLVQKLGVEPTLLYEILVKGLFDAPAYHVYGKMIIEEDYNNVGATAMIGLKDVNLALSSAVSATMPLPSANVLRDRLLGAIAHGDGELDWAVIAREQARASGL